MKRNVKFLLLIVLVGSSLCLSTSCRNLGKYVDDVGKYADDFGSSCSRRKPKPKSIDQKTCTTCSGTGVVYDAYGNRYECSNCGGDGKVWLDF